MRGLIGFWLAVVVLGWTVAANAQMTVTLAECDLNFDRVPTTTVLDYGVILAGFGAKLGAAGFDHHADRNNDDMITVLDWGLMLKECPLGGR